MLYIGTIFALIQIGLQSWIKQDSPDTNPLRLRRDIQRTEMGTHRIEIYTVAIINTIRVELDSVTVSVKRIRANRHGTPILIDHGYHEVHRQSVSMGLVRLKLTTLFKSRLGVLEYLARFFPLQHLVGCRHDIAHLAMYIGAPGPLRDRAMGQEVLAAARQLNPTLKPAIRCRPVANAFACDRQWGK